MGSGNKIIKGTIAKGLGEGAYFMSMPHYKNQIKDRLGFAAYPGTLNIKTEKSKIAKIKESKPIRIDGFESKGKILGGASCFDAKIKEIKGSIIMPDINKHEDIIEFIASVHVKTKLNIKDGDKIKVEIK